MGLCGSKQIQADIQQTIVTEAAVTEATVATAVTEATAAVATEAVTTAAVATVQTDSAVNRDPATEERIKALWVPTKLPA
jgi:hypothetical protein